MKLLKFFLHLFFTQNQETSLDLENRFPEFHVLWKQKYQVS